MDLVGNTYKFWWRDRDRVSYSHLINLLLDLDCSAFVGAGLSVHAGYPTFSQLVEYLMKQAKMKAEEFQTTDSLLSKVTEVKKVIEGNGGNFYEVLYQRFDSRHFPLKIKTELFENFIKIPFRSIVTTNYDSCLEEIAALENLGFSDANIQVFPHLNASNLEARRLYHVHGRIDHNDIDISSTTLILTTEEFDRAYSSESPLPGFLSAFLDIHNVLFIGFALEERTLFDILELSKRRKDFVLGYPINPPKNPPVKFAILPLERNRIDPQLPKEDIQNYLSYIDQYDRRIESEYDVIILRYFASSGFSEMEAIIKNIYTKIKDRAVRVTSDFTDTGVPS
jgi:hypothetical protein